MLQSKPQKLAFKLTASSPLPCSMFTGNGKDYHSNSVVYFTGSFLRCTVELYLLALNPFEWCAGEPFADGREQQRVLH